MDFRKLHVVKIHYTKVYADQVAFRQVVTHQQFIFFITPPLTQQALSAHILRAYRLVTIHDSTPFTLEVDQILVLDLALTGEFMMLGFS